MRWGKQEWFCPNCGARHYGENLQEKTLAQTYQCSYDCFKEWGLKETRFILGHDQKLEPDVTVTKEESNG